MLRRVKRLQIYIDEALDEALAVEAARRKTSKAALIRGFVAAGIELPRERKDPLDELVGLYDQHSGAVDDVVYGS